MCSKQNDRRETDDNLLACWWYKDIPFESKGSGQDYQLAGQTISWSNSYTKDKWPLVHDLWFLHTWRGEGVNVWLHWQGPDRLSRRIFETAPRLTRDHPSKAHDEEERKVFPEKQGSIYHHDVVQLLFAVFCVRRDIQTAVTFLTTHVKAPDKDIGQAQTSHEVLEGNKARKKYTPSRLSQYHLVVGGWGIHVTSWP